MSSFVRSFRLDLRAKLLALAALLLALMAVVGVLGVRAVSGVAAATDQMVEQQVEPLAELALAQRELALMKAQSRDHLLKHDAADKAEVETALAVDDKEFDAAVAAAKPA
jgi:hypothetical protein